MISKAEIFWDKQASKFDNSERQSEAVYKEILAKTRRYLAVDDKVLDFGCATGSKTLELAKEVKHIHGLDFSAEMIRNAVRKKDEAKIRNVSFSRGTIFDEKLEKSSFDKIIAYAIIHLLEENDKVIRRINDLLKPGGLFISTTACFKDKMALKRRLEVTAYQLMNKLGFFPLHFTLFMPSEVEKLIESQNFQVIEAETIFHEITACFIVAKKP